jgi:two-component system sensor histidine kinase KdpD
VLQASRALANETRAEAERQSEQLRTAVLDALAHEYKTPLTVIRTATSGLLELGGLNDNQAELVSLVDNEITRLADLTTRLLQMSRLDRTDVRLRAEPVDADELVGSVLSKMRRELRQHEIRVHASGGQAIMHADPQLTGMALTQLLDNAAKYSTVGSQITVSIDLLPREIRIAVHNIGPCIPVEERDRIFQRFYRSPGVRYRANGTGIGLSITRKIAELHGGRVAVSSNEQSGTTFSLSLLRHREGVRA